MDGDLGRSAPSATRAGGAASDPVAAEPAPEPPAPGVGAGRRRRGPRRVAAAAAASAAAAAVAVATPRAAADCAASALAAATVGAAVAALAAATSRSAAADSLRAPLLTLAARSGEPCCADAAAFAAALRARGFAAAAPGSLPFLPPGATLVDAGARRWAAAVQLGRVLVTLEATGPAVGDDGGPLGDAEGGGGGDASAAAAGGPLRPSAQVLAALRGAGADALARHVASLRPGEGAARGFGSPPPGALSLEPLHLPPPLAPHPPVCAVVARPGAPSCVLLLSADGAPRLQPLAAPCDAVVAAFACALRGRPIAFDAEFRAAPPRPGLRSWPRPAGGGGGGGGGGGSGGGGGGNDGGGGVGLVQLADLAGRFPPLLYSLGAFVPSVGWAGGAAFAADAPAAPLPAALQALLREAPRVAVHSPGQDFPALRRTLVSPLGLGAAEWAAASEAALAALRAGCRADDLARAAGAAHPCLGAAPALETALRHFAGVTHPLKGSPERTRDWGQPPSPEAALYAALDAAALVRLAAALGDPAARAGRASCACLLPCAGDAPPQPQP